MDWLVPIGEIASQKKLAITGTDWRDRVAKEARDVNHSVIANHFAMLPQVVCECWYGEVTKQSRCQDVDWLVQKMRREIASQKKLAMTGADWRDLVAKEARDYGCR